MPSDGGEFVIDNGIEAAALKGGAGGAGRLAATVAAAFDGDAGFKGIEIFAPVFAAGAGAGSTGLETVATGPGVIAPSAGGVSPGLWSSSDIGERHQ